MSQKEVKELIARAKAIGWECLGQVSNSHYRLRWPETGYMQTVPCSPSDPRNLANTEAEMARVSGPLRSKPGPGRSKAERARRRRRPVPVWVPKLDTSAPERPEWHEQLREWSRKAGLAE